MEIIPRAGFKPNNSGWEEQFGRKVSLSSTAKGADKVKLVTSSTNIRKKQTAGISAREILSSIGIKSGQLVRLTGGSAEASLKTGKAEEKPKVEAEKPAEQPKAEEPKEERRVELPCLEAKAIEKAIEEEAEEVLEKEAPVHPVEEQPLLAGLSETEERLADYLGAAETAKEAADAVKEAEPTVEQTMEPVKKLSRRQRRRQRRSARNATEKRVEPNGER